MFNSHSSEAPSHFTSIHYNKLTPSSSPSPPLLDHFQTSICKFIQHPLQDLNIIVTSGTSYHEPPLNNTLINPCTAKTFTSILDDHHPPQSTVLYAIDIPVPNFSSFLSTRSTRQSMYPHPYNSNNNSYFSSCSCSRRETSSSFPSSSSSSSSSPPSSHPFVLQRAFECSSNELPEADD
jgi:hypothetical protein